MTQERPSERVPQETVDPAVGASETLRADPVRPETSRQDLPHPPEALRSLRQAMRRARHDDAERMGAIADLRAARVGRLELLEDALQPLLAEIPEDVDLFDFGLVPGAHPRLFLDMIGFVEMGRDARTYHLVQDTRHGRRLIAESESIPRMVEAVTDYVARRLLERDKALAADADVDRDADEFDAKPARAVAATATPSGVPAPRRRRGLFAIAGAAFGFLITLLGVITFCTSLFAALFYAALQVWPKLAELWPNLFGQG